MITGYTTPRPNRCFGGMKAGQLSQSGLILAMLLRSVTDHGEYREDDFTCRLDDELFPLLDWTPANGPGGYTSQSIREAYRKRVEQKKLWNESGGIADATEAAERAIVLAVRYAKQPEKVAGFVAANCCLTQTDEAVVAMSTAYNLVLARKLATQI